MFSKLWEQKSCVLPLKQLLNHPKVTSVALNILSSSSLMIVGLARRLKKEIPNSIILDQYSNPDNPAAHYYGTAEEIIAACGDRLDMAVIGAGTGGTISGVAKRLKERYPGIKIVGVDPEGSLLADPKHGHLHPRFNQPYLVEGIGYDFVPEVMSHEFVDEWIVTRDEEALRMARRLIRSEGLLCGGSSGSAMWAAVEAAKRFGMNETNKRVVVILPDSVRNYMSKFLSADWMFVNGFMQAREYSECKEAVCFGSDNSKNIETSKLSCFKLDASIDQVKQKLAQNYSEKNPIVDEEGRIVGVLAPEKLVDKLLAGEDVSQMQVKRFMTKDFLTVKRSDSKEAVLLACASRVPVYLVDAEGRAGSDFVQLVNPFSLL